MFASFATECSQNRSSMPSKLSKRFGPVRRCCSMTVCDTLKRRILPTVEFFPVWLDIDLDNEVSTIFFRFRFCYFDSIYVIFAWVCWKRLIVFFFQRGIVVQSFLKALQLIKSTLKIVLQKARRFPGKTNFISFRNVSELTANIHSSFVFTPNGCFMFPGITSMDECKQGCLV